jgi:hypothetical protein
VIVFLVLNPNGAYWDGFGWSAKGRTFLSIAQATRSLHEEGESTDGKLMLSAEFNEEAFK